MELTGKEFKHYSKKEWIDLIEKSLKNAQVEDIRWEVFPGLEGNPFPSVDDLIPTADFGLSGHSVDWEIGMIIDQPQLSLLSNEEGSEAIWLNTGQEDWNKVAEDIDQHVVRWYLPWPAEQGKGDFLDAFKTVPDIGHKMSFCLIANDLNSISYTEIRKIFSENPNVIGLIIHLEKSDDEYQKTGALVRFIRNFTDWISRENLNPDEFEWLTRHMGLMVSVRSQMLFEIAYLRAIQYIWYNVLKAYKIPYVKLRIIAVVDHTQNSFNPNDQLILNSISTAGAAAGGADTIFIKTDPMAGNRFESQVLNKNIQLICKHEAGFNRISDPIAGSYAMEDLTSRIVQYIWKKIQESA